MVVELIGGPLDGTVINGPAKISRYMVVSSHQEGPIYRAAHCPGCAGSKRVVPYYFLGYEQDICYAYPEKSRFIQPIEQENPALQDSPTGA